ncbi:DUF624 domain-containing protein [Brachybacterium sp. J144]|uniref:DUF624 domain-containing protein n=1 Tax=Brachybacterium sp. J144 TaxID=3116487 RepID=UPI002E797B09|nr:DUF624 domain-containing protein [Brachybacterium sp. J144]MEE1650592.1 DUF624 domain-containing protein [Brachybacterium sp. J144]
MDRITGALGTAADLLLRAVLLQGLWLLGTLAGGVILGWAPATVAVTDAAARAERGQRITLRRAAEVWRAQFWRAQLTLGAPALLLLLGIGALTAAGAPLAVRAPAAIGAILLLAALLHIPSVELRHDLRVPAVLPRSALLALAQLPTTLLLAAVLLLWGGAALSLPGLIPFLGVGVPVLLSQHLVGRSLDRNEQLLAAAEAPRPAPTARAAEGAPTPLLRSGPSPSARVAPTPSA